MRSPLSLVRSVLSWPVESQLHSRRNALVAGTALAAVRQERDDVEAFLEALARRRLPAAPRATTPA